MTETEFEMILLHAPPLDTYGEPQLLRVVSLPFSESPKPSDLEKAIISEVRRMMPSFRTSNIEVIIYEVRLTLLLMGYLLHPAFPTAKIR